MKAGVLGCGGVGSEIARRLTAAGEFDELVVADADERTAAVLGEELGDGRAAGSISIGGLRSTKPGRGS